MAHEKLAYMKWISEKLIGAQTTRSCKYNGEDNSVYIESLMQIILLFLQLYPSDLQISEKLTQMPTLC
jgi:hypothetical protein